jgi:hypothetical protein
VRVLDAETSELLNTLYGATKAATACTATINSTHIMTGAA